MGKITFVRIRTLVTGFIFFSFLLLTASNPTTPTNSINLKRTVDNTFKHDEKKVEFSSDKSLSSNLRPGSETIEETAIKVQLCTITAPPDIKAGTNDDGFGNCSTTVSLGTPGVSDCAGFPAKAFVDGVEIDPVTYLFTTGITIVSWQISDGLSILASDDQQVEVVDNELPTISAPTSVVVNTDAGTCTASGVNLGSAGTSDNCGIKSVSNDAPATFPLGNTTVTWTVTDNSDNTNTATQIVTVKDTENPIITAPADVIVNTDPGNCTASGFNLGSADTSDNCGIKSVTNDAPGTFPLGDTTVTWTVTDNSDNTNTATQIVTVKDTENPIITAPPAVTVNTDAGTCTASGVNLGSAGSSDNCGIKSITNDAPGTFPLGDTTVTWTVTDNSDNTNTATQIVTVKDTENPTITAPPAVTVNTDAGTCTASGVNLGSAGSSDNCGIKSVTNDAPGTFPLGDRTVTWTVTDNSDNTNTATQIVTVKDTENPTIIAPPAVTVNTDAGTCTASGVNLGSVGTSDNCGIKSVTNDAPTTFPLGTTTVTWTVTDNSDNTNTATQIVTVKDTENPTITAPPAVTFNTDAGTCTASGVNLGSAGTSDNCGVKSVSNDAPATFPLGNTTVTWTVTDNSDNTNTATQIVTVEDHEQPSLTAPANITNAKTADDGSGNCSTKITLGNPVASDNCGIADIKTFIGATEINPSTYLFPVGTTYVTWKVYDNSNNVSSDEQMVTVLDNENPTISAPIDVIAGTSDDGSGNCMTTAILGLPVVNDNCGGISTKAYVDGVQINLSNHLFPIGTSVVTWEVTDSFGNKSTAQQNVNVVDNEAPIPPPLSNILRGCTYTVAPPIATDNCDNNITVTSDRSTTFSTSGTIKWTFTDVAGNSSTASQNITISPITATTSSTRTSLFSKNDGSASVFPSGGVAPYTYEWRKTGSPQVLATSQKATNLSGGDYDVKVIDVYGCTYTTSVTVIDAVNPEILSSSECLSVHDYIRTSAFQVDLDKITGGIGNPENFQYNWNFGSDATPSSGTGTGEFTVQWGSTGDKIVTLTITDESNYTQSFEIPHYVGGCFEGCGTSVNFDVNVNNFFIGDKDGNRLTGANCEQTTEKYLWIDITKNANGFGLSAELNYAVNDGVQTTSRKAIGCFEEVDDPSKPTFKPIPLGLFRLFPVQDSGTATDKVIWKCGETFKVLQINIRWTNQNTRGCNEGTKPMCYGPSQEVIVNTPLMAEATPVNIQCKGESSGSISIRGAGGFTPYQYSISGPVNRAYQTSNVFYNLPAGQYTFSVKDARNIVTSGTVIIAEPKDKIDASISVEEPIACYNGTGSAKVVASGGLAPYTYSWSSGSTFEIATGLTSGISYTATVTDSNGCSVTKSISLSQPVQLTLANAGVSQSPGCGITSTTLHANIPAAGEKGEWSIVSGAGGNIPSSELNNSTATFSGIAGETYILEWTISNAGDGSCSNSDQVSISFAKECSTLDFDGIDDHIIVGDFYNFQNTAFSMEAWVRPKSINDTKTILSKRNSADFAAGGYDLSIINGAISFRWNSNQVFTTHKIGTDRWYHIAVVFQGSAPEIFVDGINLPVQTSIPNVANPISISHPFMIGATYYANNPLKPKNYFHGWIEEVRIWNIALTQEQIRFMMNQRVEESSNSAGDAVVKGEILPMNVPNDLLWSNLKGYYRLLVTEIDANLGTTPDIATIKAPGHLKNIVDSQENSAPLPYISANDGSWWNDNSWAKPDYWDPPNSTGVDGTKIDWNIAYVSNDLNSGNENITLLGFLIKGGKLDMLGTNPISVNQAGTGNALTVTKYLELDGFIDLNGESQLIQTEGSILAGAGRLDRDQQGTASSFNYNYFCSPVSTSGNSQNSGYSIADVLRSGTDPANPSIINFNYQYHFADGPLTSPLRISTYWLYKFYGEAGLYNEWHWVGKDGYLDAGEGFTMKGSSGQLDILDLQNYVFTGMPNNGRVSLTIGANQNHLVGNPYPSAIDADEFIKDNLEGRRGDNIFNGSLYFWSHFSGKTHYLQEYVGGYATYNLAGGVKAVSNDARINATGEIGGMEPKQYIPPGQAFFMNTVVDNDITNWASKLPQPVGIVGGEIQFNNSQRVFQKEDPSKSVFHSKEKPKVGNTKSPAGSAQIENEKSTRKRIWIRSESPKGYHRQLLVTAVKECTSEIDLGYDAPLYDDLDEDMYWKLDNVELVIQGVPDFNKEVILPLELKVAEEGEFVIAIDKLENIPGDFAIHLKDTLKSVTHDLRKGDYKFQATPGIIKNRFSIVFLNEKQTPEEKSIEVEALQNIELFYSTNESAITILNPDLIPLKKAFIYTLNGKFLRKYDYIPTEIQTKLAVPLKTTGVYILRLDTEEGKKSIKFMIN